MTDSVPDLSDRVRAMVDTYAAEFSRSPQPDGAIIVRLTFPAGDIISGSGDTTESAVTALEARVAAFTSALGA